MKKHTIAEIESYLKEMGTMKRALHFLTEDNLQTHVKFENFGERKEYKHGDVVVWDGTEPCIGRIYGNNTSWANCYMLTVRSHDSLHMDYLRLATCEEIEILGNKEIHLL